MNAEARGHGPTGLNRNEVIDQQQIHGPNKIARNGEPSRLAVLGRQFTSPLVLMLIAAAGIAAWLGEVIDMVAILVIVVLNGALGFLQEWQAATAILTTDGPYSVTGTGEDPAGHIVAGGRQFRAGRRRRHDRRGKISTRDGARLLQFDRYIHICECNVIA